MQISATLLTLPHAPEIRKPVHKDDMTVHKDDIKDSAAEPLLPLSLQPDFRLISLVISLVKYHVCYWVTGDYLFRPVQSTAF